MEKNSTYEHFRRGIQKKLKILKLSVLISCVCMLQITASSVSQNLQISLKKSGITVQQAIDEIEKQCDYNFFFSEESVDVNRELNVELKEAGINEVIDKVFGDTYDFRVTDNIIVVRKSERKQQKESKVVKGKVTDTSGESLPGVSIMIKGTDNGVVTDIDGNYTITYGSDDAVLVFSFVGMTNQEVAIAGRSVVDVKLMSSTSELDEVVVVGYGVQKKADLTGSVASVDSETIAKRSVTNVSNALQGAVSGVSVTRSSSEPGSGNTIRVRGITTMEGSNDPLILVDDIPVESINDVNPDEIASISVLKDGASAAIYGSRAAAGVILITTKRAKAGKFSVTYSGDISINKPTRSASSVGVIRFMEMENEQSWNDKGNEGSEFTLNSKETIDNYMENHKNDPDNYPNTDWKSMVMNDYATTKRHNIGFSAGTDKIKTRGSFGVETQDALYDHYKWKRYTARINNDVKINNKFGLRLDVSYKLVDKETPQVNPLPSAHKYAPTFAAVWQDGRIAEGKSGSNIYAMLHEGGSSQSESNKLYAKAGAYYKPFKGFKVEFSLAPSYIHTKSKSFRKAIPYWGAENTTNSGDPLGYIQGFSKTNLYERRGQKTAFTTQLITDYKKSIGDHNIYAMMGFEEYSSKSEELKVRGIEYELQEYPYLNMAPVANVFDDGSWISEEAYRSLFGRFTYNYAHKYFIQANARRDGSSRFDEEYRWGTFPSVSLGWVVSEEDFLKAVDIISFLKLRASYGSLGNDRLGNYLYASLIALDNATFSKGNTVVAQKAAAQRKLAIKDITWETTVSKNFGIDVSVLNSRLSLTADYFIKETTDMLLDLSVPTLIGAEDPRFNVGSMDTKGWELAISWRDRIGELGYSASFNISDSESIIGDINDKRLFDGITLSEEGEEYRSLYGYQADGIFQTQEEIDNSPVPNSNIKPGDVKYKDISGPDGVPDGVITSDDKTHLGSSLPHYFFGGNIKLDYKGIDFGLTFEGVGERNVHMSSNMIMPFKDNWLTPPAIYDGNYWSTYNTEEENKNAKYPRLSKKSEGNNYKFSDFWIIDGSYLRIKNITLGYTIPKNITNKFGVNSLRVYVAGNDLYSFDSFPEGWDPEQGASSYLITKSYVFGVKIKF